MEATHAGIGKYLEGSRGEVKGLHRAPYNARSKSALRLPWVERGRRRTHAFINNSDDARLATVMNLGLPTADWVVVGVRSGPG
jgi:hypothetical protein